MRGGGGQKMTVFVHAQGIKTVHAGGGGKKWQNSVHVVVECHFMNYMIHVKLRQKQPLLSNSQNGNFFKSD